jgi:hypothetical protein
MDMVILPEDKKAKNSLLRKQTINNINKFSIRLQFRRCVLNNFTMTYFRSLMINLTMLLGYTALRFMTICKI